MSTTNNNFEPGEWYTTARTNYVQPLRFYVKFFNWMKNWNWSSIIIWTISLGISITFWGFIFYQILKALGS